WAATGRLPALLIALALLLGACAPSAPSRTVAGAPDGEAPAAVPAEPRTLTMAALYEPLDLASKIPVSGGANYAKRMFNASPALTDNQGTPRPYLAEALPQLNTDTWRVSPDGRMETTYRLRPGLTWHDGRSLTADDFVFAWGVYSTPGLALFLSNPQDMMEEVTAT